MKKTKTACIILALLLVISVVVGAVSIYSLESSLEEKLNMDVRTLYIQLNRCLSGCAIYANDPGKTGAALSILGDCYCIKTQLFSLSKQFVFMRPRNDSIAGGLSNLSNAYYVMLSELEYRISLEANQQVEEGEDVLQCINVIAEHIEAILDVMSPYFQDQNDASKLKRSEIEDMCSALADHVELYSSGEWNVFP